MDYDIDVEAGRVLIRGEGAVDDHDLATCVAALRADPRLRPEMHVLSDMRGIDVAFTTEGVRQMVGIMNRTAELRSNARAAIVVDSDVAFGMGRVFETRAQLGGQAPEFRIFRNVDEALRFLDGALF